MKSTGLAAFLFLWSLINTAETTVRCFECSGAACGDPFDSSLSNSTGGCEFCTKIKTNIGGMSVVRRICNPSGSAFYRNECHHVSRDETICDCDTDECNGAGPWTSGNPAGEATVNCFQCSENCEDPYSEPTSHKMSGCAYCMKTKLKLVDGLGLQGVARTCVTTGAAPYTGCVSDFRGAHCICTTDGCNGAGEWTWSIDADQVTPSNGGGQVTPSNGGGQVTHTLTTLLGVFFAYCLFRPS